MQLGIMTKTEEVQKFLLYTTNQVFKVLNQIIEKAPDHKLGFKPAEKSMPFGHLAVHVYNMCYLYAVGPVTGGFDYRDFNDLFLDPRYVKTKEEILLYAGAVKKKIIETTALITEKIFEKEIKYDFSTAPEDHFTHGWGTWKLQSYASLMSILEEAIHHRAQLNLYLRIMEIEPVFVYN